MITNTERKVDCKTRHMCGDLEGHERAGRVDEPCRLFIHPLHPFFFSLDTFLPSNKPLAAVF
jgi:hypothetical protein